MATSTKKTRTSKPMSQAHKNALAKGREQGRIVRAYLDGLEAHRPKRGRKRTPESITKQLADIEDRLEEANPLDRVLLIQQRIDLSNELEMLESGDVDITGLEADFVKTARVYSESKGISYTAWREAGVAAGVLKQAGISRAG